MKQNFPLPSEAAALAARLSDRQRECLLLVRNGLSSKEIGRLLSLSPSTVDNHVNAAIERLGCSSRIVAAQILETGERFDGARSDGSISEINKTDSALSASGTVQPKSRIRLSLPPVGGATNDETSTQRIIHLGMISVTATMAFVGITITIAGVVALFSR